MDYVGFVKDAETVLHRSINEYRFDSIGISIVARRLSKGKGEILLLSTIVASYQTFCLIIRIDFPSSIDL